MAIKLNSTVGQRSATPQSSTVKRTATPKLEQKSVVTPAEYSPLKKSRKKSEDDTDPDDLDQNEDEDSEEGEE